MAAIIWRKNVVICFCERNNDVAELVCFREAVNERNRTLRLVRERTAFRVKDPDLRVGLLDPGLTVPSFGRDSDAIIEQEGGPLNC